MHLDFVSVLDANVGFVNVTILKDVYKNNFRIGILASIIEYLIKLQ